MKNNAILCATMLLYCAACKVSLPTPSNADASASGLPEQNVWYELVSEIKIAGKLLATDKLGNSYVVTTDDEVVKFSPQGKELYRYANLDLGEITYMDATNPYNVLLLYGDDQVACILDERMNLTSTFDLFRSDAPSTRMAAVARNPEEVWIYDENSFFLRKLLNNGQISFESADLSSVLSGSGKPITFIMETDKVYLGEAGGNLYIFDIFGQHIATKDYQIPTGKIQHLPRGYVYRKGPVLKVVSDFSLSEDQAAELVLPHSKANALDARIQFKRMMILEKDRLSIFTFELLENK